MKKVGILLCLLTLSFLVVLPSESPLNIPDDIIEKNPELIWLKEMYIGATMIAQMQDAEFDKAMVLCNQCNSQYYCSHLGGLLCSQKDRKNLDTLKQLILLGNGIKIAEFMLYLCNEIKAECLKCHDFKGWHMSIQQ